MRKLIPLLLIAYCLLPNVLKAQCQPLNGDFEQWTDLTDSIGNELTLTLQTPVVLPELWYPLNRLVEIAFSDFIIDYFDLGTIDLDLFSGYHQYQPGANGTSNALAVRGDSLILTADLVQRFSCGARPERFTGQFKYVGEGVDSLIIFAILNNTGILDTAGAVGSAIFATEAGPDDFTTFDIPFSYADAETFPDSAAIIVFAQKNPAFPNDTSFFVIDELEFSGGTVSVRDEVLYYDHLMAPNPARDYLTPVGLAAEADAIALYDVMGKEVYRSDSHRLRQIPVYHLPEGLYTVQVHHEAKVYAQKIIIKR